MNGSDTYLESRYDRKRRIGKQDVFTDYPDSDFESFDSPVDFGQDTWSADEIYNPTTGDLGSIPDPITTITLPDEETAYVDSLLSPDEESAYVDSIRRGSLGPGTVIDEEGAYAESIGYGRTVSAKPKVTVDVGGLLKGIFGTIESAAKSTGSVINSVRTARGVTNSGDGVKTGNIYVPGNRTVSAGSASPSQGGYAGTLGGSNVALLAVIGVVVLFLVSRR